MQITQYRLMWGDTANGGRIILKLANGASEELNIASAAEFTAVCAVLERGPLTFDPSDRSITSTPETVSS